jgi:hypothetical protein
MSEPTIKAAREKAIEIFRKTNPPKIYPYNQLILRAYGEGFNAGVKVADEQTADPVDMIIFCPFCYTQHIDEPEPDNGWDNPPHHKHLCKPGDGGCGKEFEPARINTNGVLELQEATRK